MRISYRCTLALACAMLVGHGCSLERTQLIAALPLEDAAIPFDARHLDSGESPDAGAPVRCANASDCPSPWAGEFGECEADAAHPCAISGTRSRVVTHHVCGTDGFCTAESRVETEACVRATDGLVCGDIVNEAWSDCAYAEHCSEIGTRIRSTTTPTCVSGVCEPVLSFESDPSTCVRSTNGWSCGMAEPGPWSACASSAACATAGTQTRTVMEPMCRGGSCSVEARVESATCALPTTDGMVCGETCDDWSRCFGASLDACSGTGTQTRTCVDRTCGGGTCDTPSTNERRESQSCPLGDGSWCASSASCGPCHEVADPSRCRNGRRAVRSCDVRTGSCSAEAMCVESGEVVTIAIPCDC